jgi:exoribonuclease R
LDANLTPTHFELSGKNEACYMIEECSITASTKAAEFLLKNLKGKAILYRHRFPGFKRLDKFKHYLKKAGQSLP